ncbi:MAG: hypothetical protein WCV84_04430 [Patescibacteria group bacterium]
MSLFARLRWSDTALLFGSALFLGILGTWLAGGRLALGYTLFVFLYFSHRFGKHLSPSLPPTLSWLIGALTLLATQSIVQTLWYYAGWRLDQASDAYTLACALLLLIPCLFLPDATPAQDRPLAVGEEPLVPVAVSFIDQHTPTPPSTTEHPNHTLRRWPWLLLLAACSGIAALFFLRVAWLSGTTESIRAPWALMPAGTFAAIAIMSIAGWIAAHRQAQPWLLALLATGALAPVFFFTILIYQSGFGFDGFLHRASETILLYTGTLHPKPFYYIGQYVFTTWFARLFDLPLHGIDLALVPSMGLLLPWILFASFRKHLRIAWMLPGLLILLPLTAFITTTPQSFAYLIGLMALILATTDEVNPLPSLTLALWSVAIHPLAGLPLLGATILMAWIRWQIHHHRRPLRSWLTWLVIIGTCAVIPGAFFLLGQQSGTQVAWSTAVFRDLSYFVQSLLTLLNPPTSHAALWADWASVMGFLQPIALLLLAILGIAKDTTHRAEWIAATVLGLGMALAGYLLRACGDFAFLIDYERSNYADRLFLLSSLFLLLPALVGLATAMARGLRGSPIPSATLLLFLAAWSSAHIYNAFPKHDAATISRGWSVGQADKEAVRWIDMDANHVPYTVLANQSVSAAAIEAFGFKRYAQDIFYYPIPTGGPLYQVFLKTAFGHPTASTIAEAGRLGQSKRVYVVMNDYWWDVGRMNEELSAIANSERSIQQGKVIVYRFDLP